MALPIRIGRLKLPILCFVVSTASIKDGQIEQVVSEAVAGGATMIQLREREMPAGELVALAQRLKTITGGRALLMINDRVDVAMAVHADGVQLPEHGMSTRAARGLLGKYDILGRSVHDAEAASQATREGAEFVLAGTIYKSPTKPEQKPAGVALIKEITKDTSIPVVAIGGITPDNVADVVKAGAAGIAVVSAIASAEEPKAATTALAAALSAAWAKRPDEIPVGA